MNFAVEVKSSGRMQLAHEDDDHLLLGVDGKSELGWAYLKDKRAACGRPYKSSKG